MIHLLLIYITIEQVYRDEIVNLITNETWLTADEAIKGFADEKSSRKSVDKQKEGVKNVGIQNM